ncbi:cupin domain-containing protein [Thalassotalea fusca]
MRPIDKNTAEHYKWGDDCDGFHLVRTPRLSVIQEIVPSGCAEVKHFHHNAEQFFFVLSGIATMECEGNVHQLTAHTVIHIPAGVVHGLSNQHQQPLIFTVTSTPPCHGDRVELV